MNRRRFTLAALFPATFFTGCHSETKPARDATLFHNENIRESVADLEQGISGLEMRVGQFNAENWQDALANVQTSAVRLRHDLDELKRSLGYEEPA